MISMHRLKSLVHYCHLSGEFRLNRNNEKVTGTHMRIDGENHSLRRLAWFYMTKRWPNHQLYVINGVSHDLRWANLTRIQSKAKRKVPNISGLSARNKSGTKGVSFRQCDSLWVAQMMMNGVNNYLGSSKDIAIAIAMRQDAEFGVSCDSVTGEWVARHTVDGVRVNIGRFETRELAMAAREETTMFM